MNNPTLFVFAGGTGLMGEAAPEAIMPLRRGPGSKLGVMGSSSNVVVNINNSSQANATATSRQGPNGQQIIDVMVEDSFNRLLGSGRLDKSWRPTWAFAAPAGSNVPILGIFKPPRKIRPLRLPHVERLALW